MNKLQLMRQQLERDEKRRLAKLKEINCPSCSEGILVADEDMVKTLECPHCLQEFEQGLKCCWCEKVDTRGPHGKDNCSYCGKGPKGWYQWLSDVVAYLLMGVAIVVLLILVYFIGVFALLGFPLIVVACVAISDAISTIDKK